MLAKGHSSHEPSEKSSEPPNVLPSLGISSLAISCGPKAGSPEASLLPLQGQPSIAGKLCPCEPSLWVCTGMYLGTSKLPHSLRSSEHLPLAIGCCRIPFSLPRAADHGVESSTILPPS